MTVRELMTSNVCFVKADAGVSEAMNLIKVNNIGLVPVCDNNGTLLGLITDRDILLRALILGCSDLNTLKVSEIMTKDVASISPDMSVHDAACVFSKKKVHRLPVLESGKLIGVLSVTDLAKKKVFLAEVGDIMGSIAIKS